MIRVHCRCPNGCKTKTDHAQPLRRTVRAIVAGTTAAIRPLLRSFYTVHRVAFPWELSNVTPRTSCMRASM